MDEGEWLTERFEEHRTRLRAVAYRMLGSLSEADDAVQDAWLRLRRADTSGVESSANKAFGHAGGSRAWPSRSTRVES
jgi:DNA-directed RNA polymerase specialized sigma24 family protein